jgi:hypothetical protein
MPGRLAHPPCSRLVPYMMMGFSRDGTSAMGREKTDSGEVPMNMLSIPS